MYYVLSRLTLTYHIRYVYLCTYIHFWEIILLQWQINVGVISERINWEISRVQTFIIPRLAWFIWEQSESGTENIFVGIREVVFSRDTRYIPEL